MAALTVAAAASSVSCHLAPLATFHKFSPSSAALLGAKATTGRNATSQRLQAVLLGSLKQSQQRKTWRCHADSVDTNDAVAAGEQEVSEVKESLSEKQGPPLLTIIAGLIVAVVVIWGLWSLISAILGIFFH